MLEPVFVAERGDSSLVDLLGCEAVKRFVLEL